MDRGGDAERRPAARARMGPGPPLRGNRDDTGIVDDDAVAEAFPPRV